MHEQHNSRSWALDYKANQNFPLSHFSHYHPPISRLPVELLSEIFFYACTFRRGYHGDLVHDRSPFDKRASPMNVSHVNSDWRRVAISLPRLWIDLYILSMFPRSPGLLQLWLQRSRDAPLRIGLETRQYCWSSRAPDHCTCKIPCPLHEDPQTNEILSLLAEHSPRWEEIYFNICTYRPTPFLSLKIGDLTSLKSVYFQDLFGSMTLDSTIHHQDVFWKAVAESPLLEEVGIWRDVPPHLHWDRLRFLSMEGISDLHCLTACSLLEGLSLRRCFTIDPNNRIFLPNLKDLHICAVQVLAEVSIDSFTLPSLESLHLVIYSPRKSLQDLEQFLQRSTPPLQSLTIEWSRSWGTALEHTRDTASLILLLSSNHMAHLTSLTFMGSPTPPKLLSQLQGASFLPCLEKLGIESSATVSISDMSQMIAFRSHGQGVSRLQSLEVVIRNLPWAREDLTEIHPTIPALSEIYFQECKIMIRYFAGIIPTYLDCV